MWLFVDANILNLCLGIHTFTSVTDQNTSTTLPSASQFGVNIAKTIHPFFSSALSSTQLITSSYTDLQDYTYYFVTAPWLSVKLLRLLQNYPPPGKFTEFIDGCLCHRLFAYAFSCVQFSIPVWSGSESISGNRPSGAPYGYRQFTGYFPEFWLVDC